MTHGHRRAAPAIAVLLGLALAGCGSGGGGGTTLTPDDSPRPGAGQIVQDGVHNAQDAAFAEAMIVHHRQSLAMTRQAKGRTGNAKVLALARRIEAEQIPEISQMTRWLGEWGKPAPTASAVPAAARTALEGTRAEAFDQAFLTILIGHAKGGVRLAQDEIRTGADERAKGLAEDLASSLTSQITEMRALLG